ncbi:hypothetical protein LSTR_LSTR012783 [Laodelphax striatellus]|uniref:Uncharacterized protein n=1 Tax=Laodelphax striatellus TaxID=195883 RepID=A0A482WYF7_LAOST|nr:hypothetical protein LSTR_LSTR012783 [Laodelphax striatellus]
MAANNCQPHLALAVIFSSVITLTINHPVRAPILRFGGRMKGQGNRSCIKRFSSHGKRIWVLGKRGPTSVTLKERNPLAVERDPFLSIFKTYTFRLFHEYFFFLSILPSHLCDILPILTAILYKVTQKERMELSRIVSVEWSCL